MLAVPTAPARPARAAARSAWRRPVVGWTILFGGAVGAWLLGPASDYEAFLFNLFLAYVVVSLGTVFLVGWAGQVSFAQAAFFGIGAYLTAHLARGADPGYPITLIVAATGAACFALPMAIPAVRLRGIYLALATLAYQAAIERFLFRQIWFTLGGESIAIGNPQLVGGATLGSARALSLAAVPLVVLLFLALRAVRRSKVGRALIGQHRREAAMAACGVPIPRYRLLAFVTAAWLAGAGGSLFTYALNSAPGSNEYTIVKSTVLLAIPVIGGITRLSGAVVGSAVFVTLPEILRRFDIRNFNVSAVMGLGLFLTAVLLRGGILGYLDRVRARERQRYAWLAPAPKPVPTPGNGAARRSLRLTLSRGRQLWISPNGHSGEEVRVDAGR
ncbi:MAG: branched-chain amino acid ABC transporter permease [Actinomycetota bacterium]